MGCFVRGGKNGMGCFVRGDKNCMGCFVRGGKLMRDVLSGVSKNGMGCFVPGCFVLHSQSSRFAFTSMWSRESLHCSQQSRDFIVCLILYVPSTIFQLNRNGSSWVEPVLS